MLDTDKLFEMTDDEKLAYFESEYAKLLNECPNKELMKRTRARIESVRMRYRNNPTGRMVESNNLMWEAFDKLSKEISKLP